MAKNSAASLLTSVDSLFTTQEERDIATQPRVVFSDLSTPKGDGSFNICDRNIVEGEFGVGKRSYGLNRIMARLQETSFCVIGIALLCMNLAKRLRSLLHHFLQI